MAQHESEISLKIQLDENKVPESMTWTAEDGGIKPSPTKAAIVSVWDDKAHELLKIDLWTKDMPLDQMKKFIHQSLMGLADTMERATGESENAQELRNFAVDMGEKQGVLKKGG